MDAARAGWLVILGMPPERPGTGHGYIEQAEPIDGVRAVGAFIEKPDLVCAGSLAAWGHHYWNAGLLLFPADALAAALRHHAPAVWGAVATVRAAGLESAPDADLFAAVPAISIDHSVMERADRIAVVPVEIGWSERGVGTRSMQSETRMPPAT